MRRAVVREGCTSAPGGANCVLAAEAHKGTTMDMVQDGLAAIAPLVRSYGLPALFLLIYLESLGLPLPGETALIGAVALAYEGQLPLTGVSSSWSPPPFWATIPATSSAGMGGGRCSSAMGGWWD